MRGVRANKELVAEIIDLVEAQIRKAHPLIDKKAKRWKGNVLLYGDNYYETEDKLIKVLKSRIKKDVFNPSKRSRT